MRKQKGSEAGEKVDWVIPVGTGYSDTKKINLERAARLSESGIRVEPDADNPEKCRIFRIVVKGLPAPRKNNTNFC